MIVPVFSRREVIGESDCVAEEERAAGRLGGSAGARLERSLYTLHRRLPLLFTIYSNLIAKESGISAGNV